MTDTTTDWYLTMPAWQEAYHERPNQRIRTAADVRYEAALSRIRATLDRLGEDGFTLTDDLDCATSHRLGEAEQAAGDWLIEELLSELTRRQAELKAAKVTIGEEVAGIEK
jgi:hypothetical protein